MTETGKKRSVLSRALWGAGYVATFVAVFVIAAGVGLFTAGGIGGALTLQGEGGDPDIIDSASRTTIDVGYIDKTGTVQQRPVVIYEPAGDEAARALVFVPHYEIEAGSADLSNYLREGWAVASPTEVATAYNGTLTDDDLVFNNAALHTLRSLPQVDPERIAVVGGSAGGYTALMLGALQLGTTTTVAAAPITNAYFNFDQYFSTVETVTRQDLSPGQIARLDELTRPGASGATSLGLLVWGRLNGLPFPLLSTVLPSFAPISEDFPTDRAVERWEALSPSGIAGAITSPTTINHNTADMLVPLDQVTKRHSYEEMGASIPEGFTNVMGDDYPGMLSTSFEEQLDPGTVHVSYTDVRGREGKVPMPTSDALITINVYDDGPPERNDSHASIHNRTVISPMNHLRTQLDQGLRNTETLSVDKLALLIDRYQGNSLQLPAHEGVSDTTYGSLTVYRQEIVDTLARWADHHSLDDLQDVATQATNTVSEPDKAAAEATWDEIESLIRDRQDP